MGLYPGGGGGTFDTAPPGCVYPYGWAGEGGAGGRVVYGGGAGFCSIIRHGRQYQRSKFVAILQEWSQSIYKDIGLYCQVIKLFLWANELFKSCDVLFSLSITNNESTKNTTFHELDVCFWNRMTCSHFREYIATYG